MQTEIKQNEKQSRVSGTPEKDEPSCIQGVIEFMIYRLISVQFQLKGSVAA
jgi:hypothetical protein